MKQQQHWWQRNLLYYTVIFSLLALMIFLPYFLTGTAFIWQSDGISQHLPALVEWQKDLKHLLSTHQWPSQWDFKLGLGADFYQVFSYYTLGDIFTYGVAFISQKHLPLYYTIMIIVRLFLVGLAFLTAIKHFTKSSNPIINTISVVCYIFTGYTAFIVFNHPFFINPLIIFPLLIVSLDQILSGKKWLPFILIVTWTLWNNYYFAFMMALGALIFFIIQTSLHKKWLDIRYWINIMVPSLIGALIPMLLFLPSILSMFDSARSATSFANGIGLFYPLNYYLKLPGTLITNDNVPNFWLTGGFSVLSIMAICFSLRRFKQYPLINWSVIISMIIALSPAFAAITNGGSSPSNRWSFMLALPMALAVVQLLNHLDELDQQDFMTMLLFISIAALSIFYNDKFSLTGNFATMVALYIAVLVALWLTIKHPYIRYLLLILTIFNAFILMHQNHTNDLDPDKTSLLSYSNINQLIDRQQNYLPELSQISENEDTKNWSLSRSMIENQLGNMTGIAPATNLSILGPAHNIESYWSYQNGAVGHLMDKLQITNNSNNDITANLDNRNALSNILGIKYWYGSHAPKSYQPLNNSASVNNQTINKSQSVYPLAYIPENIIPTDTFNKASGTEREAYLANGVITDAAQPKLNTTFKKEVVQQDIRQNLTDKYAHQLHINYKTNARNEVPGIYLRQPHHLNGTEVHLEIKQIKFKPASFKEQAKFASDRYQLKAKANQQNPHQENDLRYNPKLFKWQWYLSNINTIGKYLGGYTLSTEYNQNTSTFKQNGQKNLSFFKPIHALTLNLGNANTSDKEQFIPLEFDKPGTYDLDVSVESIPNDNRFNKVAQQAQQSAVPLTLQRDKITGNFKANQSEILATTIPYSSGWSSKNQELIKVNDGFIGLKLNRGHNNIQLNYQTPGLIVGRFLSILGLISLFIYLVCQKFYHSKH